MSPFYVSSIKKDAVSGRALYGVSDSRDGVEELYPKDYIIDMVKKGIEVVGVDADVCSIEVIPTEAYKLLCLNYGSVFCVSEGNRVTYGVLKDLTRNSSGNIVFLYYGVEEGESKPSKRELVNGNNFRDNSIKISMSVPQDIEVKLKKLYARYPHKDKDSKYSKGKYTFYK